MDNSHGQALAGSAGTSLLAKDSLGCRPSALEKNQQFLNDGVNFYRKKSADADFGRVRTLASRRGFLLGVSMMDGHQRHIQRGRHRSTHAFNRGSIYIRDFSEDYCADLSGVFDFMLMEISPEFVERAVTDGRGEASAVLSCTAGEHDPVLYHLVQAMVPALASPDTTCRVFVEQMSLAVSSHLFGRYARGMDSVVATPRVLSRVQEARAKEMLLAGAAQTRLIEHIAEQCHLSPSYFIYAFRQTTGQTPHRWLKAQRIKQACGLLQHSQRSLADIAIECGFADQSHFTRVFSQVMTVAPGAWRKAIRG